MGDFTSFLDKMRQSIRCIILGSGAFMKGQHNFEDLMLEAESTLWLVYDRYSGDRSTEHLENIGRTAVRNKMISIQRKDIVRERKFSEIPSRGSKVSASQHSDMFVLELIARLSNKMMKRSPFHWEVFNEFIRPSKEIFESMQKYNGMLIPDDDAPLLRPGTPVSLMAKRFGVSKYMIIKVIKDIRKDTLAICKD